MILTACYGLKWSLASLFVSGATNTHTNFFGLHLGDAARSVTKHISLLCRFKSHFYLHIQDVRTSSTRSGSWSWLNQEKVKLIWGTCVRRDYEWGVLVIRYPPSPIRLAPILPETCMFQTGIWKNRIDKHHPLVLVPTFMCRPYPILVLLLSIIAFAFRSSQRCSAKRREREQARQVPRQKHPPSPPNPIVYPTVSFPFLSPICTDGSASFGCSRREKSDQAACPATHPSIPHSSDH